MPVKVMIKRKWQVEHPEELYALLAELRALQENNQALFPARH